MTVDLDALELVPAYWQIAPSEPRSVDVVCVHAAQSAETLMLAENLGQYFARHREIVGYWVDGVWVQRKASTHYGVDCDSIGYYVDLANIAYAAGGINHNGVHIEHAGYAQQTREEWLDDYGQEMLRLSADLTAALCVRFSIPPVWLAPDDLLHGARGITSHVNACVAFGGDHWDPGPGFPEDVYIQWVREALAPPAKEPDMPEYILRYAPDLDNKPWLAVYPSGRLRWVGGNEAGYLVAHNVPFVDEVTDSAYTQALKDAGVL